MESSPLLAPFTLGLQHNRESWLCEPTSFQELKSSRIEYGYVTAQKGYYVVGTLPSKLPITGLGMVLSPLGSKENLVWDTKNLWTFQGTPLSFTKLNTEEMFDQSFSFIRSVELNTQLTGNRIYFTNGFPLRTAATDGIWWYQRGKEVTSFSPSLNSAGTSKVVGATALGALGGRLLLFGPWEETGGVITHFPNRVRWSVIQSPDNFLESDGGGYSDAATGEEILGISPLQNGIVTTFTEGLWLLEGTWDVTRPFIWRKVDENVRCFNEKSLIPYPLEVKIVGKRGMVRTDGRQVARIDEVIPLFVNRNMSWTQREKFFGFREYISQSLWYIYSFSADTGLYRALILDEVSGSFSVYEIPFNVLGYGADQTIYRWSDFSKENNMYWKISSQVGKRVSDFKSQGDEKLFGGDEEGNIYHVDSGYLKTGSGGVNIPSSSLLTTASWNPFVQQGRQSRLVYVDLFMDAQVDQTVKISFFKDDNPTPYKTVSIGMLPSLGFVGEIGEVTRGRTTLVNCPQHGFTYPQTIYIYECQGMTQLNSQTPTWATPVDVDTLLLPYVNSTLYSQYTGGGKIFFRPFSSTKIWKRVYGGGTGFIHQISLEFQGVNVTYFKLHAIKPRFVARGKRLI